MHPTHTRPVPADLFGTHQALFFLLGVGPAFRRARSMLAATHPAPRPAQTSGVRLDAAVAAALGRAQMADMFCFRA